MQTGKKAAYSFDLRKRKRCFFRFREKREALHISLPKREREALHIFASEKKQEALLFMLPKKKEMEEIVYG